MSTKAGQLQLLDPKRVIQIGIRGSIYQSTDYDFARAAGIRIVFTEEFSRRGVDDVRREARDIVGTRPVYVSFDVYAIDPAMAPETGTPENGGFGGGDLVSVYAVMAVAWGVGRSPGRVRSGGDGPGPARPSAPRRPGLRRLHGIGHRPSPGSRVLTGGIPPSAAPARRASLPGSKRQAVD